MDLFKNTSLGRFQSLFLGYQQFNSGSSIHLHTPFMNQQCSSSQKKHQGSSNQPKTTEKARISSKALWCISFFEVMTSDDQQRELENQCHSVVHCLLNYTCAQRSSFMWSKRKGITNFRLDIAISLCLHKHVLRLT